MKKGKAIGRGQISPEMLKGMGPKRRKVPTWICDMTWNTAIVTEASKMVIVVIHKIGDITECGNYKGIT